MVISIVLIFLIVRIALDVCCQLDNFIGRFFKMQYEIYYCLHKNYIVT